MTRQQAVAKLKRLYGAKFYYRVGEAISSPESREACKVRAVEIKAQMDALAAEICRREEAAGISELRRQKNELFQQRERLQSNSHYQKFSVGTSRGGIFTEITGSGDTWEEAIASAEAKQRPIKRTA